MKRLRLVPALLAVTLTIVCSPHDGPAQTTLADPFAQANAAYAAGEYEAAAAAFRALAEAGLVSSALLYDLGNAESKAGRPGEAVLSYERALALSPRDPDVLANLRQTRTAANLPEPERTRWQEMSATLTVDEWSWLAAAALWAACLLLGVHALRSDGEQRPSRILITALTALVVLVAVGGSFATTRLADLDRAVVVGPGPALRVAPFESATVSTELAAGSIVDIDRFHEDFALVRTAEGQAGWMPKPEVEEILAYCAISICP
ncbi:MAG: tetratricopeptide repeat protein [Candidatus Binatia bacterium]|nr:tetratricopeptide repeat protein [Candidatus Binatia bacterium]